MAHGVAWGHWFPHASQDSWGLMGVVALLSLSLSCTHIYTHTLAFTQLLQEVGGSGEVQAGLRFNTCLSFPGGSNSKDPG